MSPSLYGNRSKVFVLLWKKMMQIGQGVLWLYFCPFILEWSTLVSVFVCKNELKVLRQYYRNANVCVSVCMRVCFPCQLIMISFGSVGFLTPTAEMSMQCICIVDIPYLLQNALHLYLDISGGRQKLIYYCILVPNGISKVGWINIPSLHQQQQKSCLFVLSFYIHFLVYAHTRCVDGRYTMPQLRGTNRRIQFWWERSCLRSFDV